MDDRSAIWLCGKDFLRAPGWKRLSITRQIGASFKSRLQLHGCCGCDACRVHIVRMEVVHKSGAGVYRQASGAGDVPPRCCLTSSSEVFRATNSRSVCCQPVGHLGGGSSLTLCAMTEKALPTDCPALHPPPFFSFQSRARLEAPRMHREPSQPMRSDTGEKSLFP